MRTFRCSLRFDFRAHQKRPPAVEPAGQSVETRTLEASASSQLLSIRPDDQKRALVTSGLRRSRPADDLLPAAVIATLATAVRQQHTVRNTHKPTDLRLDQRSPSLATDWQT